MSQYTKTLYRFITCTFHNTNSNNMSQYTKTLCRFITCTYHNTNSNNMSQYIKTLCRFITCTYHNTPNNMSQYTKTQHLSITCTYHKSKRWLYIQRMQQQVSCDYWNNSQTAGKRTCHPVYDKLYSCITEYIIM